MVIARAGPELRIGQGLDRARASSRANGKG